MKWQKLVNHFWAIKGGVKSGERTVHSCKKESFFTSSSAKVVVEDAVLLGESNSVKDPRHEVSETSRLLADKPNRFRKKRFVSENVGRPNSLDGNKLKELLRLYYSYPYSFRQLADMFGVSRMTVWRAVQTTQALVTTR